MKYEIMNLEIRTVPQGKSNAGSRYLEFSAVNTQAPLEVPGVVCIFNERTLQLFAPYILQAKGGTATVPTELPESFRFINGRFETFVFPTPGMRRYSRAVTTKDGKTHNPGEIVMNGSQPRIYKSAQVFVMRQTDQETGEVSYLRGWDCDTRGMQMYNAFYEPIVIENAVVEESQGPVAGVINPTQPTTPWNGQGQF